MASTSPLRRLAPGALAVALLLGAGAGLAACGGDDVSRETFYDDFSEASPLEDDVDRCIVDDLFAKLSQDEINDFYSEDPSDPLSASNERARDEAVAKCTAAGTTTTTG